jgi:hypothetical protein
MDYNPTAAIMANVMVPSEPTRPCIREHRVTRGGRHLWYELEVIQQPERARACGSGAKSSADRRPVDPPPVLQFKVKEGDNPETARDITFDYNADFFVFASLEHSRPMAHGRVQTPAATSPPVLTGFPVAGCSYLDRPVPAGYFIFPDLSVRHEGRYRLIFSLYEQIKTEQDGEVEPRADEQDAAPGEDDGQGFYHRMEIKSDDFVVFSAKKFPGLAESTALSRTVAEQGCRVRIRRDVRMRKRPEGKAGDYDDTAEDEFRRRRTETPDGMRARSMSNTSMHRAFPPDHQRLPSNGNEYIQPAPPIFNQGGDNMLNFGKPKLTCAPHAASYMGPPSGPLPSTPVSPAHPIPYHGAPAGHYQLPPQSPGYAPAQAGLYDRQPQPHEQEIRPRAPHTYPGTPKHVAIAPAPELKSRHSSGSLNEALPTLPPIRRDSGPSPQPTTRIQPHYPPVEVPHSKRRHDDVFIESDTPLPMKNGQRSNVSYKEQAHYFRSDGTRVWLQTDSDGHFLLPPSNKRTTAAS